MKNLKKQSSLNEYSMSEIIGAIQTTVENGGVFSFVPRGASMLPTIKPDIESVGLTAANCVKVGDIVLYKRSDGSFVMHRVVHLSAKTFDARGDNQLAVEKDISRDAIMAKLLYYTKNGKKIKARSFAFICDFVAAYPRKYIKNLARIIKGTK